MGNTGTTDKVDRQRTNRQNSCLHKLFSDVATELLNQNIERRTIMLDLKDYSCPVDETFIKEVWRAIQYTQTNKKSTTELTTAEIQRVYETFNRFLGENYGIHLPWPSIEEMMATEWYDNQSV